MRPDVGCSKPPIIRRVVVLPQPDGPSRLKNSPSRTSRSMWSTATASPNFLTTSTRRTSMSADTQWLSGAGAGVVRPRPDGPGDGTGHGPNGELLQIAVGVARIGAPRAGCQLDGNRSKRLFAARYS